MSTAGTIYVLSGSDDFSKTQFLAGLRSQVGPEELHDSNITTLKAAGLTLPQLEEVSGAVPFLAERRLVVVEGLLSRFEGEERSGRRNRPSRGRKEGLSEWAGLPGLLGGLPPTTMVAFVEASIGASNPLLQELKPLATVREFRIPAGDELRGWIRHRVAEAGSSIRPQAVAQLGELVGGDLWAMAGEIEKLVLHAGDEPIDERDVAALVSNTRETTIFQVVDAVLAGNASRSLPLVNRLRRSGADASYVLTMLGRQLRLVLLGQELLAGRVPQAEMKDRLGLRADFAARAVVEQARRYSPATIAGMYRSVLDADLAIKRGEMDEHLAVETLVADIAQKAARSRR